ncbi:MAG: DNA methylase [Firmicutes bacterium]|nr:DNA methylase [Bacillota bacterium]
MKKTYIAIDLKSFYASVECRERNLDPLTTNLVVADASRSEKTICLAVSPSLKSYGISGRARLYEVIQKITKINKQREYKAGHVLRSSSFHNTDILNNPNLAVGYIIAKPRMALYMDYSTRIYNIYNKYVSSEDIHVYSIDEVFMDVTSYLHVYKMSAQELAKTIIQEVLQETGITATAGIADNLFLSKVAMDIVAKHIPADKNGVRIAHLDEQSYREQLWKHKPLTDFWRVGKGYAKKLEAHGMYTMGDIALCSLENEDLLYKLFGVNAELLIDHAWGWEPCTIKEIKAYKPESNSLGQGQVLMRPYSFEEGRTVLKEMAELLSLDLVKKRLVTDKMVLTVGYDIENLKDVEKAEFIKETKKDWYGRELPKSAHGTYTFESPTSSTTIIQKGCLALYDRIVSRVLSVRRFHLTALHVLSEDQSKPQKKFEQYDLFTNIDSIQEEETQQAEALKRERAAQEAILKIKDKYGKNSILKGTDLEEEATTRERNRLIGGHKA